MAPAVDDKFAVNVENFRLFRFKVPTAPFWPLRYAIQRACPCKHSPEMPLSSNPSFMLRRRHSPVLRLSSNRPSSNVPAHTLGPHTSAWLFPLRPVVAKWPAGPKFATMDGCARLRTACYGAAALLLLRFERRLVGMRELARPSLPDAESGPSAIRVEPHARRNWHSRKDSHPHLRRSKRRALVIELREQKV